MSFTLKDFEEFFLAKKNGTYKCTFCGKQEFAVNLVSDRIVAKHSIPSTASDGVLTHEHDFYSISCTNCGHADFFHNNQVKAWIKSRKSGDGNG